MNVLKEEDIKRIISCASELFLQKSISKTSMEEIADAAGCGVASLYRHYKTKDNIAVKAAILLSKKVLVEYFNFADSESGYEEIKQFYYSYNNLFCEKPNYFRFLTELDSLYLKGDSQYGGEYEQSVEKYHVLFVNAYNRGIKDGTVKEVDNIDLFYYSSAHALLNMCKYLSISNRPLLQDNAVKHTDEIRMLCDMLLNNIMKEN